MRARAGIDERVEEGWIETGPEPSWNKGREDDDDKEVAVAVVAVVAVAAPASSSTAMFGYSAAVSAALTTHASLACLFQGAAWSSAQTEAAAAKPPLALPPPLVVELLGSTNPASASIVANCPRMSLSVSRHCCDRASREATAAPAARAAREASEEEFAARPLPPPPLLFPSALAALALTVAVAEDHASNAAAHTRWSDCCPAAIEGTEAEGGRIAVFFPFPLLASAAAAAGVERRTSAEAADEEPGAALSAALTAETVASAAFPDCCCWSLAPPPPPPSGPCARNGGLCERHAALVRAG